MNEEITENYNDFKEQILSRLKVPIFYFYLFYLGIYNWDIIILIWKSNNEVEDIISFIKLNYSDFDRILIPLFLSILSLIIFPIIMLVMEISLKTINKKRIEQEYDLHKVKADKMFEVQEARNKTDKLNNLNNIIESKNNEIKELIKNNNLLLKDKEKLYGDSNKLSKILENKENELKELENSFKTQLSFNNSLINYNRIISEFENPITEKLFEHKEVVVNLLFLIGESKIEVKDSKYVELLPFLNLLVEDEFITISNIQNSASKYQLTKKGRNFYYYISAK